MEAANASQSELRGNENPAALRALAAAYFFAFACIGVQMPLVAPALLAAGYSAAWIGGMWALRSLTGTLSPTLWGTLADRFGDARPYTIASLGIGGVLFAALGFTSGRISALFLFALYGLVAGASMTLLDGMTLTALGKEKHRYGNIRLYGALGFGVAALFTTSAVEFQWIPETSDVVFPIAGFFSVAGAIAVFRVPRLQRPKLAKWSQLKSALQQRELIGLGLLSLLHWSSHGAYSSLIAPLGEVCGLGRHSIGIAMGVAIVFEVWMMRSSGAALRRFGAKSLLVWISVLTCVRWLGLALSLNGTAFIAWQALHGVSFGLFYPSVVAILAVRVPEEARQSVQGLFGSLFFGVGGAIGTGVAGAVFEQSGALATWWAMVMFSLAALGVSLALTRIQVSGHSGTG